METPLKSLIDKFRAKPDWQHPDPAIRAEAVLRLSSSERETLLLILRDDPDPRVRRAAVKKLSEVALLAERAREDTDEGVREEAGNRLAALAIHGHEEAGAAAAVGELREARHLGAVAKSAALQPVRLAAVARLADARLLAAVVRECDDGATRTAALARIDDPALLLSFALKSDQRPVAMAAVERIADRDRLEAVAARARVGAAARRARLRLDGMGSREAAPEAARPEPPPDMDEGERLAYEQARAAQEVEAAERARRAGEREAILETLDQAQEAAIPDASSRARAAWQALEPFAGAEADALARRFEDALRRAEQRHESFVAGTARRAELDALCVQGEDLALGEDLAAARSGWSALEAKWNERIERSEQEGVSSSAAAELRARFEAAHGRLRAREAQTREERVHAEKESLHRLVALCDRLEALVKAENPTLRDTDHALRDAKEALDNPGALPTRRDRETVMPRLEAARKALYPLWQQLREDTEWKRWANVAVQEELCARAEALAAVTDLEKAAEQLRDLDARWKQAKEAPKEKGETLWNRFKAARDPVKARCDAYFARQAAELLANLKAKQALVARAEALADSTDWLKTAEELKKLQAEWKAIGPVARAQSEAIWRRFRKPCDRFFTRRKENQDHREQEWSQNLAKKTALCERAEALQEATDWEATAAALKALQGEWKVIGAVRKNKSEAIWARFRKACDHFFERYKDRDNLERQAAVRAREALCSELEALLPAEGTAEGREPPADLVSRVMAAPAAWRQAGEVSRDQLEALNGRFTAARNRLIELWPASFQGTDLDPEANRRKAEKLCARVEEVLAQVGPGPAATTADLAERLKDALATNTIGGREAVEAKWQAAAAEVESAQAAWSRLGPVPGPAGHELDTRFEAACRRFREQRPRTEAPRNGSEAPRGRAEAPRGRREPRDRGEGPRADDRGRPRR